jgi:hypothetical protein
MIYQLLTGLADQVTDTALNDIGSGRRGSPAVDKTFLESNNFGRQIA